MIEQLKKKDIEEAAKVYSLGLQMQIPKSYLPLEEIIKNLRKLKLFVYRNKTKIKGLLSFTPKGKNSLEIDFICSLELRKGIGKKLIKRLAEFSVKRKIRTIYSNVSSKDKRVINFYESCGFEVYGKPRISNKLKLYKLKTIPQKILNKIACEPKFNGKVTRRKPEVSSQ